MSSIYTRTIIMSWEEFLTKKKDELTTELWKPKATREELSLWNEALRACLRLYKIFLSLSTMPGVVEKPGDYSIYTSLTRSPCKNALLTSTCRTNQPWKRKKERTTLIVVGFITKMKVSK